MSVATENPVNLTQAAAELGMSPSYLSAIKRAMGIRCRYFYLSDVRKFIRTHPDFRRAQIYPRSQPKSAPSAPPQTHPTQTS